MIGAVRIGFTGLLLDDLGLGGVQLGAETRE